MAQNVYNWDFIHRYFPQEQIEKYRQQIINDWKSDLFNNEEIWEKYGISENTFYDLIKRYAIENENGLKDKSKKPKNPCRKLEEDDGKIVVENLKFLRKIIPNEDKIEIRSDGGTEFNNAAVLNYCKENNILLHIIPKASPCIQAFIERSFRTLKQEFLNLVWIGNLNKLTGVLGNTEFIYP